MNESLYFTYMYALYLNTIFIQKIVEYSYDISQEGEAMRILLIIGFLIPFVILGYFMSKLDKFLENEGFAAESDNVCPTALVLGDTELAKRTAEILKDSKMPVFMLTEPCLLDQGQNFHYLFALSDNDVDNILLCKIGAKVYNIEKMISLCNDQNDEGIFKSEKIPYLSGELITAQKVVESVLQKVEMSA